MDENVIFDNNSQSPPPQTPDQADGATPPASPPLEGAPPESPPPEGSPDITAVTEVPAGSGNGGKIKLIIGGVIFLIVLIFIIFLFIPKNGAPKPVKLVWWGLWEDSSVMQGIISDFQRQYPYITVVYSEQDPNGYRDRLIGHISNGTGPDIFRFHNTWYPMLSSVLSPLSNDVITLDEFKKDFYPVMQQDLVHTALYGIPLDADTLELFVNTDMLNAAGVRVPKNWVEFKTAANKLTVPDSNDPTKIKTAGVAMGTYDNITHAPDIISLLFAQQNIAMDVMDITKADPTYQADAITYYTSFITGNPPHAWDNLQEPSILAFTHGKLAMYFGFSWDAITIQAANPELNFKIYPVPGNEGGNNTTIASYWVEGVNAKSPNQKAAFLFMHYLAQKDTAQKFYDDASKKRKFGEPFARRDLAGTLKNNDLVYPFESGLEDASSSIFASDTHDGDTGLNQLSDEQLQTAINTIVKNGADSTGAVKQLDDGILQVIINGKYGQ